MQIIHQHIVFDELLLETTWNIFDNVVTRWKQTRITNTDPHKYLGNNIATIASSGSNMQHFGLFLAKP